MDNVTIQGTATEQTAPRKTRRKRLLRWGWDRDKDGFVQREERSDRVVRLIGGEIRKLRQEMWNAVDLAWLRLCPNRGDDKGLSDRSKESLEAQRDDEIDGQWGDGGNPGSVMLDRRNGYYYLMAWALDREPGVYMRWIRLDPATSDTAIRRRVRRFLLKHDPLGNLESLYAPHVEDTLEECP